MKYVFFLFTMLGLNSYAQTFRFEAHATHAGINWKGMITDAYSTFGRLDYPPEGERSLDFSISSVGLGAEVLGLELRYDALFLSRFWGNAPARVLMRKDRRTWSNTISSTGHGFTATFRPFEAIRRTKFPKSGQIGRNIYLDFLAQYQNLRLVKSHTSTSNTYYLFKDDTLYVTEEFHKLEALRIGAEASYRAERIKINLFFLTGALTHQKGDPRWGNNVSGGYTGVSAVFRIFKTNDERYYGQPPCRY